MELLIDTQVLIWFQLNHPSLSKTALEVLTNPGNTIYVSDISLYEITIKQTIGKLSDFNVDVADIIAVGKENGFDFLSLNHSARSEEHTSELQSLMRISYAVFCLTKKHNIKTNTTQ